MRLLTVLLLLVPLAACARGGYDLAALVPEASAPRSAGAGTGPRFDDNKPHEWQGRAPWHYAVHGTDVSRFQGEIDWPGLRRGGISFAFIKATEGGDLLDPTFHHNWREARAAGVPRGAYHFFYFCRPAIEQARWFIEHVPRDPHALPPVLDMEWNHLSPTCRLRPPPEVVRREMQVFLDTVERHYGKRPIIYTTIDFFTRNEVSRFQNYPLWLRSVAGHPSEVYGKYPWVFWQYTGTGVLPGIRGNADINVFNGNTETWRNWLRQNAGGSPPTSM